MNEELEQVSTPETVVDAPVTPEVEQTTEPVVGQTEQAAETDEQRNERLLAEREDRSKKRQDGIQKRFNELTAEKRELMDLVKKLSESRIETPKPAQPAEQNARPDRSSFDSYEDFIRAEARWEARQALGGFVKTMQQQQVMKQAQEQAQVLAEKFDEDVKKVRQEFEDYDDVVSNLDFDAPPSMVQAILESDSPARLFHALGKNPEEAKRIARMSPLAQAKAIGKIEAALSASATQVSKAPPPGKPVGVRGGPIEKDPKDMNYDEFVKWRKKQISARR